MKVIRRLRKAFSKIEQSDQIVNNYVVRQSYHNLFLTQSTSGVSEEKYPEGELIVSLTSYGNKLNSVYLTVESLLNQTLKPNRIILWLDQERYTDRNNIPLSLQKQEERGLEIALCKDVRSYTKLVPALLKYPDSIIITTDDDMIYPIDFVERLFRAYQRNPKKIYCYRGHYLMFNSDGTPKPYLEWVNKGAKGSDIYNVPTGVSGVIYPPHCYHEDMLNDELFLKLCPHADDVWFKVMTYLKGTVCEKIDSFNYDKLFVPLDVDNSTSLQNINVVNGGNDEQIRKVFKYYNIRERR